MGMCPIFLFYCLVGPVDVTIVQVCLFTDQLSLHQKILKIFVYTFILSILLQRDWGGIANTDNCPWEPRLHLFDSSREVALPTFRDIQTLHSKGGDHWRLKNTRKYILNLNRWPSLEVHHWATILRFLTTIWFLQYHKETMNSLQIMIKWVNLTKPNSSF